MESKKAARKSNLDLLLSDYKTDDTNNENHT